METLTGLRMRRFERLLRVVREQGEHATWVLCHARHMKDALSEVIVGEIMSTLRPLT